ncbi:PRC-barrel domain-containing protein [Streptomyces sp. V1I1]|uniref:PRC-barrel domain-containing protein n=1 Tax=Streptomyces sp. V1I1 TaxID=3042272 RepID=UPI00277E2C4F|nr:PRC-barrel domain-containing protein [Streptomyces sp. V1I1]MDQ0938577.1 hypothetical protein [Streptomyces sp. V1I1]
MTERIWEYQPRSGYDLGIDLVGFKVEATDGHIGKIDKQSDEVGSAHIVVDIGMWIFGKHVLLPAGTVTRIDQAEETVYLNRTKDQIKDAPEFEQAKYSGDASYLEHFARYYGQPHM